MTATRFVALLVLVAVGLTVAPIASGAVVGVFGDDPADVDDGSETETTVSTFMQSSAADAEHTVDAGMFDAQYDRADNDTRTDMVLDKTDGLEDQLETLEAEREELRDQELDRGEYQARMTQFTVEIRALERDIDRTERRANETGVDADRLAQLRTDAADLSGPEVAATARGLAGISDTPGAGPPDDGDRGPHSDSGQDATGPPDDSGPPPNQTESDVSDDRDR